MDADTFGLLANAVEGERKLLRAVLDSIDPNQRGSSFADFVSRHLDAIEALASSAIAAFPSATVQAKGILGNKLTRCRGLLHNLHEELVCYQEDIGRQDLPPGLLYLIDSLIGDLLKASADPLIHLDGKYMYSTQRVLDRWKPLSTQLGVVWNEPAEPVIFNLPGLDPGNAFISPVLAHEVGHSVIQRNDLVLDLLGRLDPTSVKLLEDAYLSSNPSANLSDARDQFQRWAEELLCDALATELTGPSFVFAIAVFFPASAAGQSGPSHPDPAQRFAQALDQLRSAGWDTALSTRYPMLWAWLETLPSVPPALPVTPRDQLLRSMVDLARPTIIEVARDYLGSTFSWDEYEGLAEELESLLAIGIPPAELAGIPVPSWHIVVAAWLHAVVVHGEEPENLVIAVENRELNRFTLKSIEMSRVAQLWSSHAS